MLRTNCIPDCPARLVAEDAFKANPDNTKKFFIEVQQLEENYRSKVDLSQSASDWLINEYNKLSQKYGFPSIERLNELCICASFKKLIRITKAGDVVYAVHKFSLDTIKLINFIYENNYSCTFGEASSTKETDFKDGAGRIDSLHYQRLSVDLNIFDSSFSLLTEAKDYEKFGIYWESLDPINRWGGRFTRVDASHFERNFKDE